MTTIADLEQMIRALDWQVRQVVEDLNQVQQPRVRQINPPQRDRKLGRPDDDEVEPVDYDNLIVGKGLAIGEHRRTGDDGVEPEFKKATSNQKGNQVYNLGLRGFPETLHEMAQDDLGDWWLLPPYRMLFVAETVTTIPPGSGTAPGKGQVYPVRYNPTSGNLERIKQQDSSTIDMQLEVLNFTENESGSQVYVFCARDNFGDIWFVSEACPP